MTTKKRTASRTGNTRKLKLKKETVKDLDVKGKGSGVKGGLRPGDSPQETKYRTCTCIAC